MRARFRTTIVVVLAVLCACVPANAQAATRMPGGSKTTVFGFVWNASNEGIAYARVQLRNVATGRAEATAVAADNGEFRFENLEGGTYVIEYVNDGGKVLAVGHVFSVAAGETVATFIRLVSRSSWFAALLGSGGNAAAAVIASAASLGITALAPASRPVSAEF